MYAGGVCWIAMVCCVPEHETQTCTVLRPWFTRFFTCCARKGPTQRLTLTLFIYSIYAWLIVMFCLFVNALYEWNVNRWFPEITGEVIQKSEASTVGHHFRHGLDLYTGIYKSMISEWRQQSKSAGLWQYQIFRHRPVLYNTGLPAALYAWETLLFSLHTTVFLVEPHAVCPFGMADWLNQLWAFLIYTVFLIV